MSLSNVTLEINVVDRFTPALHRARYLTLTPIGRRIPTPKGTYHRQLAIFHVRVRQLVRTLERPR